jgi:hypothetical protein
MKSNRKYTPRLLGYTVRLKVDGTEMEFILCTDEGFHNVERVGPGQRFGAKLYNTLKGAVKRASGLGAYAEEEWA